jgi:hypothetical protein
MGNPKSMRAEFYCTLFDAGYLSRGLAMLESLLATEPGAQIAVFCFDAVTLQIVRALALPGVRAVSMEEFEDPALLSVKSTRSTAEYCWTSTPATIAYCLDKLQFPVCTYLDADLFFFASPSRNLPSEEDYSVLITDHFYTPRYDQSETSGKYCVQFMHFKNDAAGRRALFWWRDACLVWCYNRFEDGKFGDQKYLDDWPTRFEKVRESPHRGFGVAPWNVQQYSLRRNGAELFLEFRGRSEPVIFYHFHALKIWDNGIVDLSPYRLPRSARREIYDPYLKRLRAWENRLAKDFHLSSRRSNSPTFTEMAKRMVKGTANFKIFGKAT